MEGQLTRQHGHHGHGRDEELPGYGSPAVMQGEDAGHHDHEHHEKKSMLVNVKEKTKEKAKKIKQKLKHSHGHGHDHDHNSHDEDDDEELVEDPEVHGAPMYDSAAVRTGVGAGQQHGVNLEKPTSMGEDRYDTSITDPPTRPFSQWEHEKSGQGQLGNIGERGSYKNKGTPGVEIGNPMEVDMEEDPNAPKDVMQPSNYQSKVTDPTNRGGAEVGVTPILHSLDKMSIYDEPHPHPKHDESQKMFTGSHDQFSPEPIPENTPVDSKDPGSAFKAIASGEKETGYTEKISSAPSALAEKAVAAKNIVATKLGYGEGGEKEVSGVSNTGGEEKRAVGVTATVTDYGHKTAATVTETLAPVTEKVANVGSSMLSKVQGGPTGQAGENKGMSKGVKEYLSEKLRPSEEDKALSEVISDTLHRKKPEVEEKPVGKVTTSEEVERRLGIGKEAPKREKEGGDAQVEINANPAVLERVKGWFGIGQSQSSQPKDDSEQSSSLQDSAGGERRLQESLN